jgi:DNA-binding CsgD family transcriptional regulator
MTGNTHETAVRITRKDLAALLPRRISTELDDAMLLQLRRMLPAKMAGHCEWLGPQHAPVWLRWHWYYDERAHDFVVTADGIESNIVLLAPDGQTALPQDALTCFALNKIRRRRQWHPITAAPARPARPASQPMPVTNIAVIPDLPPTHPDHRDGTEAWADRVLPGLAQLPDNKQFSQIAKLARERFGFNHTLALAHDPLDPGALVVEDNFLGRWQEVYQREHLIMIDPRLHGGLGPAAWSAREQRGKNAAFWTLAMENGIGSGWLMRSTDGTAALVLSRPDAAISDHELAGIEPNLRRLAALAHQLMQRMLASPARYATSRYERALPENDIEIIGLMLGGKGRKEIAAITAMSIPTIDRRIKFMKKKLGADTTPQLVDVALRMGLISRETR